LLHVECVLQSSDRPRDSDAMSWDGTIDSVIAPIIYDSLMFGDTVWLKEATEWESGLHVATVTEQESRFACGHCDRARAGVWFACGHCDRYGFSAPSPTSNTPTGLGCIRRDRSAPAAVTPSIIFDDFVLVPHCIW